VKSVAYIILYSSPLFLWQVWEECPKWNAVLKNTGGPMPPLALRRSTEKPLLRMWAASGPFIRIIAYRGMIKCFFHTLRHYTYATADSFLSITNISANVLTSDVYFVVTIVTLLKLCKFKLDSKKIFWKLRASMIKITYYLYMFIIRILCF